MGNTNKGNEQSKKLFKIAATIVVFSILPLAILIVIDRLN